MSHSGNAEAGFDRRGFLQRSLTTTAVLAASGGAVFANESPSDAIAIGSRRELFVDDYLIDTLVGGAHQQLHQPVPREIALQHDAAWEGTGSGYHSIFRDGDLYRMYYKAWHLDVSQDKVDTNRHPLFCCYAESDDGITWRKPMLGLHEFNGSKQNNITMTSGPVGPLNLDAGHPAVL